MKSPLNLTFALIIYHPTLAKIEQIGVIVILFVINNFDKIDCHIDTEPQFSCLPRNMPTCIYSRQNYRAKHGYYFFFLQFVCFSCLLYFQPAVIITMSFAAKDNGLL